jgi:hypothetical protein
VALRKPRSEVHPPPTRVPALTAATAVVDLGEGSSWKTWKFGNRDWQVEAWRLYDIVPEHHFLSGRIGESVAQARLYVAEVSETGEETGEVTEERIANLAAVPLGTGSQRDDNLRLAGTDLAVGGECWIVGEGVAKDPLSAKGAWWVVTSAAIKRQGDKVKVKRPKTRGGEWLELQDGRDILVRCWRPHPNDTDQADSFTRSAIVPLREIELLTKREFAELDSRLTGAGVMFLPEGIDFPRGPEDPEGITGFMAYIQRAAAASMKDQSTASAMVPIMATLPDHMIEHLANIKPVTFWSELSAGIGEMKDKAIARLAASAEIPGETLTGIGNANHWTAWLISEEGTRWIKGYLGLIADSLTRGFLHLALGFMGVLDPERYAFAFDVSTLAARPNRLDEALQLHDRFLLSDAEAVRAGAFDEDQMPTTRERVVMVALKLVQQQPDLLADPAIQTLLGFPPLTAIRAAPAPTPPEEPEEDDQVDGPPNGGGAPDLPDEEARAITAGLNARIISSTPRTVFSAASKLMVLRALELAGGRLTTPAERRGRWAGIPRHELHARVGPITPDKAEKVLAGAWIHVPAVAADLGVSAEDLGRLLTGYTTELLIRGMAHHDDLLYAALSIANRGRGLTP